MESEQLRSVNLVAGERIAEIGTQLVYLANAHHELEGDPFYSGLFQQATVAINSLAHRLMYGDDLDTRRLIELVERKGGRVTPSAVAKAARRFAGDSDAAERSLQRLVDSKVGIWESSPVEKGGRPTRFFVLTPGANP